MVSISEYFDKRGGYFVVEIITRNPRTAERLREDLPEKFWYDEQEERKIRYRFRFPRKRKEEVKKWLSGGFI